MKLEEITIKNIRSFIEGHARSYLDKICLLPHYTKEQVFYRIYTCRNTCIPYSKCEKCTCPAIGKSYATQSCNLEKFPNLMQEVEWEEYKVEKSINEKLISTILSEVKLIFNK